MGLKRRPMRPMLWGLAVFAVIAAGVLAFRTRTESGRADGSRVAWKPLSHRVEVQVLNGGTVPGLALAMTRRIRATGLDVVLIGDAGDALRDSTRHVPLVLVRRGDTTGVGRLRELFDTVELRDAPDARPLVDLTVVFGGGRSDREPPPNTGGAHP